MLILWKHHYTEVRRAPLIELKNVFLNKVFYRLKLFRKFKFYTRMTISGRKSVKKSQKMMKKATNLVYYAFLKLFFCLIWNILMTMIRWNSNLMEMMSEWLVIHCINGLTCKWLHVTRYRISANSFRGNYRSRALKSRSVLRAAPSFLRLLNNIEI